MKANPFVLFLTTMLLIPGCKSHLVEPESTPDPELNVVGIPGKTKTFSFTNAAFIQGTNEPFIVPPESLKPSLQFPESLYTAGIFTFATVVEQCTYNRDTLVVTRNGSGFNLFSVISNWYLQHPTEGEYGMQIVKKYIHDQNTIYEVSGPDREIVYKLPLQVGSSYSSFVSSAVFRVASQDTITSPAGVFSTFRIDVNGRFRSGNSETHYVSPNHGIIKSELRYPYTGSVPWDSTYVRDYVEVQRYELISIK